MFSLNRKSVLVILLSLITFTFMACSDDDDPVQPQEEHFEAIGAVIYDGTGAEIARILRGVTCDTLYAQVGVLSDHYDVKFINDEEEVVNPPSGEEHTMGIVVTNTDLLETEQDEPGAFEFHLQGKAVGVTTVELQILHDGHSDYRSGLIPVRITN